MSRLANGTLRSVARSKATELAEYAPQAMREYLAPYVPEYCEALLEAMRTPTLPGVNGPVSNAAHRTAMSLIPQILRAVGANEDLLDALLTRLAMPNEASLAQAAELYRAVQGQDIHAVAKECRTLLAFYEQQFPNGEVIE